MTVKAIIFGGIGTVVETSDIQRRAFNLAFEAAGLNFKWDQSTYCSSLAKSGGQSRLSQVRLNSGEQLSEDQIKSIHGEKTRRYGVMLAQEKLPLRPGVAALIQRAGLHEVKLAWATTTSQANIDAIFNATRGSLSREVFTFVGNDTVIMRQKPDPQIYEVTLNRLKLLATNVLAIEDSLTGIAAAQAALIPTIAFPGEFNRDNDFTRADDMTFDLTDLLAPVAA